VGKATARAHKAERVRTLRSMARAEERGQEAAGGQTESS
jgi:hypothetical protein